MSDELSERVLDLEVRLAYQDRTIAALDDVVRELAGKLAALQAELALLRAPPAAPAAEPAESSEEST